jgi:hypothetical protein
MRSQLKRAGSRFIYLFAALLMFGFISCKKETVEVTVDAFAQLDTEVKKEGDVVMLLFTLQPYPYAETGVRTGPDKSAFYKGTGLTYHKANAVSNNRYGIYLDAAYASKDFYYQIYVKDAASSKEIYSDVFSSSSK